MSPASSQRAIVLSNATAQSLFRPCYPATFAPRGFRMRFEIPDGRSITTWSPAVLRSAETRAQGRIDSPS